MVAITSGDRPGCVGKAIWGAVTATALLVVPITVHNRCIRGSSFVVKRS